MLKVFYEISSKIECEWGNLAEGHFLPEKKTQKKLFSTFVHIDPRDL